MEMPDGFVNLKCLCADELNWNGKQALSKALDLMKEMAIELDAIIKNHNVLAGSYQSIWRSEALEEFKDLV